jgi:hypothetical protein
LAASIGAYPNVWDSRAIALIFGSAHICTNGDGGDINLRHLRYFIAAAEEWRFGKPPIGGGGREPAIPLMLGSIAHVPLVGADARIEHAAKPRAERAAPHLAPRRIDVRFPDPRRLSGSANRPASPLGVS